MGCDIHGCVEKKVGDKWVMVDRLDDNATNRNYRRFAALAGVRGDGPDPKGLPEDISESGQLYVDEWGIDGHSHSYLELKEAAIIFLATDNGDLREFEKQYPASHYFDIENDLMKDAEYRLVFWFDN